MGNQHSNNAILSKRDTAEMEVFLIKIQLKRTAHRFRMDNGRIPKQIPFVQIPNLSRSLCRRLLRYKVVEEL